MTSNNNNNIPWLEKYRPSTLKEIISQEEAISIFNNALITGDMPHLLIHGGPGTGKTSAVLAFCRQLYGPRRMYERVIELNASDERGINIVRHKIMEFACKAIGTRDPKYLCPPFKIIILDEADAMTKEAQAALRKIMEEQSRITRFCFICNYINQIIEPINSRCVKIRFRPIKTECIVDKLSLIAQRENINITNEGLNCIADISNGDFRKNILLLQNLKYIDETVITDKNIYDMCKYITTSELRIYIDDIRQNKKIANIINITKDIINKGYIFNSVVIKIIDYIINNEEIKDNIKSDILFEMGTIEKNINDGADEYIQLLKLLNSLAFL